MQTMSANRSRGKRAIAAEVWRLMAGFTMTMAQRGRHVAVLKELGLTPGHLKALGVLQPGEPRPMGALAEAIACDASMVTWLVDRLEERGLVERKMLATDRRVKTVALTPLGVKTKERLFEKLYEPPAELLSLDHASLEALLRELAKLPRPTQPFWSARTGEDGTGREGGAVSRRPSAGRAEPHRAEPGVRS